MDLPVADAVQQLGFASAFGFGHEVVGVLLGRRNLTPTQWAHWAGEGRDQSGLLPALLSFDFAQHGEPLRPLAPRLSARAWRRCGKRQSSI